MRSLITTAMLTVWLAGGNAQDPSPQEVAWAIEQGRAGKAIQKKCAARGDNGMDIIAEGPLGRIMRAAREARRRDQGFSPADVTTAMAGPWLTVTATRHPALLTQVPQRGTPGMPNGGVRYETEFVIKSRPSGSEQPVVLEPVGPITYRDSVISRRVVLSGPAPAGLPPLAGGDMAASFDFAAFRAIPHSNVDVIIFMTDTGEQKCRISERERMTLK